MDREVRCHFIELKTPQEQHEITLDLPYAAVNHAGGDEWSTVSYLKMSSAEGCVSHQERLDLEFLDDL